jgi:hypothetical protein
MTAPRRRNGVLVTTIERGCESKRRYPDELTARAAGQFYSAKNEVTLYLYPCSLCRGWHLTRKVQRNEWQNVNYEYEPACR